METNITEQQYQKLLQYLDESRSKHMTLMYICIGGTVLDFLPGITMFSGFGNVYVTLAGFLWICCVIGLIVLFLTGYQKHFGGNSSYSCVKRRAYSCAPITISTVSGSEGRPPYLLNDSLGLQYVSPVYMEFRKFRAGSNAIGLTLINGKRFAFAEPGENFY